MKPHMLEWSPEKVKNLWDYYGSNPAYDEDRFSKHSGRAIVRWAHRCMGLTGKKVVDYGCGPGFLLRVLLDDHQVESCVGIEFSEESLSAAQEALGTHPCFGGVFLLDTVSEIVQDASIDVVFLVEVIEHLDDAALDMTLKNCKRLLKPGGRLVVTTPNREDIERRQVFCPDCGAVFHPKQHVRTWDQASLTRLLKDYGLHAETVMETNWLSKVRLPVLRGVVARAKRLLGGQNTETIHLGVIARSA